LSSVHAMTRVVIRFGKSQLQSIVQSAAEFHDRNLPGIEHVLFLPVSGASFLYQKNGARNPVHTSKFSGARNLRQKLASLNACLLLLTCVLWTARLLAMLAVWCVMFAVVVFSLSFSSSSTLSSTDALLWWQRAISHVCCYGDSVQCDVCCCYGDSVQYHVFEMSRPLPRFSMYSLLDSDHGIPEPQSHVTFHVKERINRVSCFISCLSIRRINYVQSVRSIIP